jgi:hypothetical protein
MRSIFLSLIFAGMACGACGNTTYNIAPAWGSGTAYTTGQMSVYSSVIYTALQNGTNHEPDTSPTYWLSGGTGYTSWLLAGEQAYSDCGGAGVGPCLGSVTFQGYGTTYNEIVYGGSTYGSVCPGSTTNRIVYQAIPGTGTVTWSASAGARNYSFSNGGQAHVSILGIAMNGASQQAVFNQPGADDLIVNGATISALGTYCLYIESYGSQILNSTLSCPTTGMIGADPGSGTHGTTRWTGNTVTLTSTGGSCLQFSLWAEPSTTAGNTCHANGGTWGIQYVGNGSSSPNITTGVISGNYIDGTCANYGININTGAIIDLIANNIVVGCRGNLNTDNGGGARQILYNVLDGSTGGQCEISFGLNYPVPVVSEGNVMRYLNGSCGMEVSPTSISQGFTSDYNDFYPLGSSLPVNKWNNTTPYTSLAAFTSATGHDAHSIATSPAFANPGGGTPQSYEWSLGSPLHGAGSAQSVVTDFFGTGRPQNGLYDIGAFQYPLATFMLIGSIAR